MVSMFRLLLGTLHADRSITNQVQCFSTSNSSRASVRCILSASFSSQITEYEVIIFSQGADWGNEPQVY